jgi:hypothetical protein
LWEEFRHHVNATIGKAINKQKVHIQKENSSYPTSKKFVKNEKVPCGE